MTMADDICNKRVLICGCGYKPVGHVYTYRGKPTHSSIDIDGRSQKMNIGTAIAYYLSRKGIPILMVSRSADHLAKIKIGLTKIGCDPNLISFVAADITSEKGIDTLIQGLHKNEDIYWVQSIGMGGSTYNVPNDNIYLPFEKIQPDLVAAELSIVTTTHELMLNLLPFFRAQIRKGHKAKIVIITSMSGERGYHYGTTHVAAKHALVGYIKGIERELKDEGIEIFDVRPGGVDTGMYDNPHVRAAVAQISIKSNMWGGRKPHYAKPTAVAKIVFEDLFGRHPRQVQRVPAPYQT